MKKIILINLLFSFSISLLAQKELPLDNLFQKKEFIYKQDTLKYRIMYPKNYDRTSKYPIVLFLHGSGERGCDNEQQLTHGASLFANEDNRLNYSAIVIFPQCPTGESWVKYDKIENGTISFPQKSAITKPLYLTKKLLDQIKRTESTDNQRIYIAGLSMGAMGVFDMIMRYPRYFAAAVSICGAANNNKLKKVRKMPIRMFHGADDRVISKEHSRNAYIELKANGAQKVEYIEFPNTGHDSWTEAFAYPDFLGWMFYQSK